MTEKSNSYSGTQLLAGAAALVIIIMGINQAEQVLASFLVAVFLSIIGTPPVLFTSFEEREKCVKVFLVSV